MSRRLPRRLSTLIAAGAILALPRASFACGLCYGDPNSPLNKGAANAVIFMIGIVVVLLTAISFYAYKWKRRGEALVREAEANALPYTSRLAGVEPPPQFPRPPQALRRRRLPASGHHLRPV